MDKQKNPSSRSLHKQKLRERKLSNLATRLKSNILKRKKSMLVNKNG